MLRVGVIGASGYAGAELVRYLILHPSVEITYLASSTYDNKPLSDAFPSFLGFDLPICKEYNAKEAVDCADFFFTAQGNGVGMQIIPELIENGKKVVDIPADFRIKDPNIYKHYYKMEHTAIDLLKEAVYGLCELHSLDIVDARLVANPGCYSTCSILALAPLAAKNIVDVNTIIVDAKSGVSGAGRSKPSVSSMYCEINEGFKAYAVATHRHTAEIEQELSEQSGKVVSVNFTPHLIPMNRGILTTSYACMNEDSLMTTQELIELYKKFYLGCTFIRILDEGEQPNTKNVFGTNFCHIGIVVDSRTKRVIVTSAIDNMGKGAAGQAVQNMNIMFGLDETTGLMIPAVYP
ncbi:MAG: N-acetyl-gamma-glutamyl-phosphate reductase [Armatimonadota bacterium]